MAILSLLYSESKASLDKAARPFLKTKLKYLRFVLGDSLFVFLIVHNSALKEPETFFFLFNSTVFFESDTKTQRGGGILAENIGS